MTAPARRLPAALACCALLAVGGAGCGGDDDGGPAATAARTTAAAQQGRAVDDAQALVLARLLQLNWQSGGARFTGSLPLHGQPVELRGRVDFRDGRGEMTLTDPTGQERRYVWTRRTVRAQAAPGSGRYVAQAPDPSGDPVHAVIAFLNLLSAETIDNTTNIKDQGARWLGRATLDGEAVDRYRYGGGGRTSYWVGVDDGLLRKVQARLPDDSLLTVRLTAHGPVRVALPRAGGR